MARFSSDRDTSVTTSETQKFCIYYSQLVQQVPVDYIKLTHTCTTRLVLEGLFKDQRPTLSQFSLRLHQSSQRKSVIYQNKKLKNNQQRPTLVLEFVLHLSNATLWVDSCDMIYLLTAVGFKAGGSSTVHIYTKTIHRTTQ